MSDVSPTRPVNLTVERSAIRQGKKNTEVYDLTVSWEDPSNDGSDCKLVLLCDPIYVVPSTYNIMQLQTN